MADAFPNAALVLLFSHYPQLLLHPRVDAAHEEARDPEWVLGFDVLGVGQVGEEHARAHAHYFGLFGFVVALGFVLLVVSNVEGVCVDGVGLVEGPC